MFLRVAFAADGGLTRKTSAKKQEGTRSQPRGDREGTLETHGYNMRYVSLQPACQFAGGCIVFPPSFRIRPVFFFLGEAAVALFLLLALPLIYLSNQIPKLPQPVSV